MSDQHLAYLNNQQARPSESMDGLRKSCLTSMEPLGTPQLREVHPYARKDEWVQASRRGEEAPQG